MLAERRRRRADGRGWEWAYNVANVEYTEFERLGVPDEAAAGSALSRFPANTNVLYVGLQARALRKRAPAAGGLAVVLCVGLVCVGFDAHAEGDSLSCCSHSAAGAARDRRVAGAARARPSACACDAVFGADARFWACTK